MLELVIALVTLTALEIVLGIDNIIFIAIIAGKLPPPQQPKARQLGLAAALITRLLLLLTLSYIMSLDELTVFTLPELPLLHEVKVREVTVRELILLVGGLFLIAKSVHEIHDKIEHAADDSDATRRRPASFFGVIVNIAIMDIIFSLDSVITAIGMVNVKDKDGNPVTNPVLLGVEIKPLYIMCAAVIIAVIVMLAFSGIVSNFVSRHPTIKVLALSFLILIGVLLVAEGFNQHLNKGYIYFAMAFALIVEMLNIRIRPATPHSSAMISTTS